MSADRDAGSSTPAPTPRSGTTARSTRPPASSTPGRRRPTSARSRRRCGPAAGRLPGPDPRPRAAVARPRGGQAPRHPAGPRAAVRAARARQDHAGDDRRHRARAADPHHLGPGHPARRRPRVGPLVAGRGRGALPRRDPPDVAPGRGDALPRHGGLPGRRHRRQGPRRHGHPARAAAVHRGRRHDPGRAAARAVARPVRLHRPPRLLRRRRPRDDPAPLGPAARASTPTRTASREIALRSRGTPRIANRLLRRVRDWAQVHGEDRVTHSAPRAGARAVRRRRARPRPARPGRPRGALPPLRRGPGRASRPWPSPWARSPTPSRRSPSPTSCARASWCAPRAAGPPRAWPGSTSASPRRATRRRSGPPRCRSTRPAARVSTAEAGRRLAATAPNATKT